MCFNQCGQGKSVERCEQEEEEEEEEEEEQKEEEEEEQEDLPIVWHCDILVS